MPSKTDTFSNRLPSVILTMRNSPIEKIRATRHVLTERTPNPNENAIDSMTVRDVHKAAFDKGAPSDNNDVTMMDK